MRGADCFSFISSALHLKVLGGPRLQGVLLELLVRLHGIVATRVAGRTSPTDDSRCLRS